MEVFVKDMEIGKFLKKFPEWASVVEDMRSMLPDGYGHYLVDFIVMDCVPGMKTCRDTRWHFDGDYNGTNKYVLWVSGPNRTEFLLNEVKFDEVPAGREEQNQFLEETLADKDTTEAPDGEPVLYDSKTPHRGVVCTEYGQRRFLRLMATDYISPKNIVKRGQNVPF